MTNEALFQEALALPERERADLAAELLASLHEAADGEPDVVRARWDDELKRRAERITSGHADLQEWSGLRQRLASSLNG